MAEQCSRRDFIGKTISTVSSVGLVSLLTSDTFSKPVSPAPSLKLGPKVGLVTYLLAKDWDVPTLIKNCTEAKFEGVELRTTHAHKVETNLTAPERKEVKKRFEDSSVKLCSLGSAFEYHAVDPAEVKKNIDGTKEYILLAKDVGAEAVKVRPNGLQTAAGIPVEKTLEQIGRAARECAQFGKDNGIQVRMEIHGKETSRVPLMKKIIDYADHDNFYVCWNSNETDLQDGGLESNFNLVKNKIAFVHMRDLFIEDYPWRKFFSLLNGMGYIGYCCAEIPESADPIRVMKYYRALFMAYQNQL